MVTKKEPELEVSADLADLYLSDAEVLRRLDGLSSSDCWRLEQVARIYADGTGYSAGDLLQEAFVAALSRRAWRADLDTRVFLTGVMRSLAFSRRKAQHTDALDIGLQSSDEEREGMLGTLASDDLQDPSVVLAEDQEQHMLLSRLERLFAEDTQVLRAIQGRALGESASETRKALGVTESQYETICRRLLRGYQNCIRVERHE